MSDRDDLSEYGSGYALFVTIFLLTYPTQTPVFLSGPASIVSGPLFAVIGII